jgi:acetylglutamate kinase
MLNRSQTEAQQMANEVATTILEQLGGRKLIAMTGAHSFTGDGNSLIFKLPSSQTRNKIKAVKITLTPADDYTAIFYAMETYNVRIVSQHEGIYCDQLQTVFEEETGVLASLVGRNVA